MLWAIKGKDSRREQKNVASPGTLELRHAIGRAVPAYASQSDFPLQILPTPGKARRAVRGLRAADSVADERFISVFQMGRKLRVNFVLFRRIQPKTEPVSAHKSLRIGPAPLTDRRLWRQRPPIKQNAQQ